MRFVDIAVMILIFQVSLGIVVESSLFRVAGLQTMNYENTLIANMSSATNSVQSGLNTFDPSGLVTGAFNAIKFLFNAFTWNWIEDLFTNTGMLCDHFLTLIYFPPHPATCDHDTTYFIASIVLLANAIEGALLVVFAIIYVRNTLYLGKL